MQIGKIVWFGQEHRQTVIKYYAEVDRVFIGFNFNEGLSLADLFQDCCEVKLTIENSMRMGDWFYYSVAGVDLENLETCLKILGHKVTQRNEITRSDIEQYENTLLIHKRHRKHIA